MIIRFASSSIHSCSKAMLLLSLTGVLCTSTAQALTVTRPASGEVIVAGDDYATQVLGNAWDMSDAVDVDTEESAGLVNQTFNGLFSGDTAVNGANFYPLHMGFPSTVNLSRGANFPIDTSHYRYITIKIRTTQPPSTNEFYRTIYLENGNSYNDLTLGEANYYTLFGPSVIITTDLVTDNNGLYHQWLDFPQVTGLRVEPATTNAPGPYGSVHFDIDWMRLTAPATNAQKYTVQWTDTGGPFTYSVAAIDTAGTGTSYLLGSGISGTSYLADMTFLAPGQYQIQVSRSGSTQNSGTFNINSPPQIVMIAPSAHGEQTQNFAQAVVGNPWGPLDPADLTPLNFSPASISYAGGTFYGRPLSNDSGWLLNLGGHTIDTSVYRSLCYTMKVFGQRNLFLGSVARVFWGNGTSGTQLTTSQPIPVDTGLSEYCIADLAAAPLEASPNGGTWSGTKAVLRLDPDEFTPPSGCSTPDTCYDVQLNSVTLSPFAHANPGYTFAWSLTDTDNPSATLSLSLDPDATPGNGNEFSIHTQVASNGPSTFAWPGTATIPSGTYHVLVTVNDGLNIVNQYAGGVLIVTSDDIFRDGFGP